MKRMNRLFCTFAVVIILISCLILRVFAATAFTVDNCSLEYEKTETQIPIDSAQSKNSSKNGGTSCSWDDELKKFTITATNSIKNSVFLLGTYYAQNYCAKVTITNTSSGTVTISYTTEGIDGIADGTYSKTLTDTDKSISFSVTSNEKSSSASTANTVKGYITINSVVAKSDVDISFASSTHGSYSYQVGTSLSVSMDACADTSASVSVSVGSTVTLTKGSAEDGYSFYGWMGSGKLLGTTDGAYAVDDAMQIYPVFLPTEVVSAGAPFKVGSNYYMFWHLAFADAKVSGNTVVLVTDYTLPTTLEETGLCVGHSYTDYVDGVDNNLVYNIPFGVKFLIPYSSSDEGTFQKEPENYLTKDNACDMLDTGGTAAKNYTFRKLIAPSGTTIDCYGQINVNGQRQKDGQPYSGVTLGGYGKIILGEESKTFMNYSLDSLTTQLKIRKGGVLYCYGYITGSGMVEIEGGTDSNGEAAGGRVYELLQICDWPGGSNANNWNSSAESSETTPLFLLSQYYIQNIEAPLKLEYGATACIEAVLTVSSMQLTASSAYVGIDSGLFQLTKGACIYRIYDFENDRMNYHLSGTSNLGSIAVSQKVTILGQTLAEVNLNSANYILPLNSNMSVIVEGGGTLNVGQKIALLPGAEAIVKADGTVNLTDQIYIWDVKDWSGSYFFNRISLTVNDGYSKTYSAASKINIAPLPYVATLDGVSPRSTANGVFRGYFLDSNNEVSEQYYVDPQPCTVSGKLEVDGTLNISGAGAICTSDISTADSKDKVVIGTGTIINNGTPTEGSLATGYTATITKRATTFGLGNLAGIGDLQPFGQYTYYGTPDGQAWYNYTVSLEPISAITNENFTLSTAAKVGDYLDSTVTSATITPYGESAVDNVIGFVAYDKDGNQSSFTYSFNSNYSGISATNGTASTTALTGVSGNAVLTLTPATTASISTKMVQMVLGNALDMRFAFPYSESLDGGYAIVTKNYADGRGNVVVKIDSSEWVQTTIGSTSYYYLTFSDISAKEMSDNIYVTIYGSDGKPVSVEFCESVQSYIERCVGNYSEDTTEHQLVRTMLVDMLNYGSAAQAYFDYGTDKLANVNANQDYATTDLTACSDGREAGTNFAGSRLELTNSINLQVAFNGLQSDMYAVVAFTNHRGKVISTTVSPDSTNSYFSIDDIVVADGRQPVTVTVYDSNGNVYGTVKDGVASYVARTMEQTGTSALYDLCEKIMMFSDSAYAYLHGGSTTQ